MYMFDWWWWRWSDQATRPWDLRQTQPNTVTQLLPLVPASCLVIRKSDLSLLFPRSYYPWYYLPILEQPAVDEVGQSTSTKPNSARASRKKTPVALLVFRERFSNLLWLPRLFHCRPSGSWKALVADFHFCSISFKMRPRLISPQYRLSIEHYSSQ